MDCRSIEIFYNVYKNSIGAISKLEQKLLNESYSYERWFDFLREKSRTIRELYTRNEDMFRITIGELLARPEDLTYETAEMFLTHVDFFISEGYRDYGVVVPVLEILIPFYEKLESKERLADCYYFFGKAVMEQHRFAEAEASFARAALVYPDLSLCGADYRKYRIMCAHYERLLSYSFCENVSNEYLLELYQNARRVWVEEAPDGFLTKKKSDGIESILRIVTARAVDQILKKNGGITSELESVIEEEYKRGGNNCAVFIVYNKILLQKGKIGKTDYANALLKKREQESRALFTKDDYGTWDFIALFDDELADDDFSKQKLFYINSAYAYTAYLAPELLKNSNDGESRDKLLREICRYYSGMGYISNDSLIDFLIQKNLEEALQYCSSLGTANLLIETIFVHRQICTEIHSLMVGRLAEMIIDDLIKRYTAKTARVLGMSEYELLERRAEICAFVKQAGLTHDLGKIACSEVINLQSRRIQYTEFEVIKKHPLCGAALLEKCPVLKQYAHIALGHHKSYDGNSGYPADFDNTASPYRPLIDLISICDSIDAATDGLGRNYVQAKTFREVLGELKEKSGERYNGDFVDLIARDDELIEKIESFTGDERAMVQFQVYKRLVRPDVNFEPEDEKYIRLCREEDIEAICVFSGENPQEQKKIFAQSNGLNCIILNGRGKIFGAVFASPSDAGSLDITQITVDKPHRKQGCGAMLLNYLIDIAYPEGYRVIYMRRNKGHHNEFAWRNGFSISGREGYLERRL